MEPDKTSAAIGNVLNRNRIPLNLYKYRYWHRGYDKMKSLKEKSNDKSAAEIERDEKERSS